jgi:hypothetical protein
MSGGLVLERVYAAPVEWVAKVVAFAVGLFVVQAVLRSAVRTVVVPRGERVLLSRVVFLSMRGLYGIVTRRISEPERREAVLARFAPMSLLALAASWVTLVLIGFVPMYWAMSDITWEDSLLLSGSSITTLGFTAPNLIDAIMAFIEAFIGLGLLAMLIAYLPTLYGHFSRREAEVVKLETFAGSPPSASGMILRLHRVSRLDRLDEIWKDWEQWFVEVEESHTSQPSLIFFRSQHVTNSWITAAGTVLDTAALSLAALDLGPQPQAALTIRSGYLTLRAIALFYNLPFDDAPAPNDPISISRTEFDAMLDGLEAEGVALKPDREQAWRDFAGWRVNYDTPLLGLCAICEAPAAPWSSDRAARFGRPTVWRPRSWRIAPLDAPRSW